MINFPGRSTAIAVVLLAATSSSHAAVGSEADTSAAPTVDPAAVQALKDMSSYLRTLKQFTITAQVSRDKVINGGGKLQFDHDLAVSFVKGKGLHMASTSPQRDLEYFYNREKFTLYSPKKGFYTTVDAPSTVGATMTAINEKYGVELPLSDIFWWGTESNSTDDIEGAIEVGTSRVNGQDCKHYAYRQADVDWQICIAGGDQPIPLKLLITTTNVAEQPEYIARMQWNLNPTIDTSSFTFVVPRAPAKIEFAPITAQQ